VKVLAHFNLILQQLSLAATELLIFYTALELGSRPNIFKKLSDEKWDYS